MESYLVLSAIIRNSHVILDDEELLCVCVCVCGSVTIQKTCFHTCTLSLLCTGSYLTPIFHKLGYESVKAPLKELWDTFNEWLEKKRGWRGN